MDFASDLPAAIDTLEIAFDDIGRAELLNGRLRLTFYREVAHGDGSVSRSPVVCLVCSPLAWQRMHRHSLAIVDMIEAAHPCTRLGLDRPAIVH
jgi:hypothetical protein